MHILSQNARSNLIEGVTVKIGTPDTTEEGKIGAVLSKTQQPAVLFKAVLGNDVRNKSAFNINKSDALGKLPTVYQETPILKRFRIDTMEDLDTR